SAILGSGTLLLPDAEVQLLSGDIGEGAQPQLADGVDENTTYLAGVPRQKVFAAPQAGMMNITVRAPQTESAGESHLYTLPEHVSFSPGALVVVPLFEPTPATAVRQYVVPGAVPYYGGFNQQPDEQTVPVAVSYHLARKLGTPFGDLPLPAGYVGVFEHDRSGRVQLVGQGNIDHTAPGVEMVVDAGSAFDITARRVQTEFATSRTGVVNGTPTRTTATVGYRVNLQNAKDSAVSVEVREDRAGEWSVVESSVPAEKRSATRTVFLITIAAKGSAVLTYRLHLVW
ncbi:MAG: hypothetical protein ACREK8_03690, partial [Gemmatimonadales bacterium]